MTTPKSEEALVQSMVRRPAQSLRCSAILAKAWANIHGWLLGNHATALLCLAGFGVPALFSLVTLPVEFNASRRALKWLQDAGMAQGNYQRAQKALFWAAMTYVVGALGAVAQAFYFARLLLGHRRAS